MLIEGARDLPNDPPFCSLVLSLSLLLWLFPPHTVAAPKCNDFSHIRSHARADGPSAWRCLNVKGPPRDPHACMRGYVHDDSVKPLCTSIQLVHMHEPIICVICI